MYLFTLDCWRASPDNSLPSLNPKPVTLNPKPYTLNPKARKPRPTGAETSRLRGSRPKVLRLRGLGLGLGLRVFVFFEGSFLGPHERV